MGILKLAIVAAMGWLISVSVCCASPYIKAPPVPQPRAHGDLVGLVLENASLTKALPARFITFGEIFAPGKVAKGAHLIARVRGRDELVQADVKNRYPDGSVKFAVLTLASPRLAAGAAVPVILQLSKRRSADVPVNLLKALARNDVLVTVDESGASIKIDAARLLREELADHTASPWLSGPLVTSMRVARRLSGSLRLVMDLRAYHSGTIEADIEFDNDIAMRRHGGPAKYSVAIDQAGDRVYSLKKVTQYQYQDWHIVIRSGGRSPINVIHDVAAMERAYAIPAYELRYGVAPRALQIEARQMAKPSWGAPLSSNAVTTYMPMTGGRWDIGPTTAANAIWLIAQDPVTAAYALGQADAAGAVPWHMFNLGTGTFLTTSQYPRIWDDGRAVGKRSETALTQQVSAKARWHADRSHQPDLSFIPYLMTGRRYYLDQLNAQASWDETSYWPSPKARNYGEGIVVGPGAQPRAAAWSLREIADAAYIDPEGSKLKVYFKHMVANNLRYLLHELPAWTVEEGQAYGWFPGVFSDSHRTRDAIAPWQEDFFATTIGLIAERGNADARRLLMWENHFLSDRFLSSSQGFNPHNGITYALWVYNPKPRKPYKTWREIEHATVVAKQACGNGWGCANGYYAQTALAALSSVINVTGSQRAWRAYKWLQGSGAPYIRIEDYAKQPQYWIVPLPDPR